MKRTALSAIIIGLSVLCLLYVWLRLDLIHLGYRIEQLEKEKTALERRHEDLQVHWSQLTSPESIANAASKKLGLQNPRPDQIILVTIRPKGEGDQSWPETELIQLAQK